MPGRSLLPRSMTFKVAVCDVQAELCAGSAAWRALCDAVALERPDLLLLSEMPFGPSISSGAGFDNANWQRSLDVAGWIIDPSGDVVAETSAARPVAVHHIQTAVVRRAQREYPCYVEE